jgi:hypothetical protein
MFRCLVLHSESNLDGILFAVKSTIFCVGYTCTDLREGEILRGHDFV